MRPASFWLRPSFIFFRIRLVFSRFFDLFEKLTSLSATYLSDTRIMITNLQCYSQFFNSRRPEPTLFVHSSAPLHNHTTIESLLTLSLISSFSCAVERLLLRPRHAARLLLLSENKKTVDGAVSRQRALDMNYDVLFLPPPFLYMYFLAATRRSRRNASTWEELGKKSIFQTCSRIKIEKHFHIKFRFTSHLVQSILKDE